MTTAVKESPEVKYGRSKDLRKLSEEKPERLYPRFDEFLRMFEGENTILRWNATRILGNLAAVDRENRLEAVLDRFLAPITGHEMIGAGNVIAAAAQIALAKPRLADHIAAEILKVETATYKTPECRNVAIGHAILSFERFFDLLKQPKPVLEFVRRQRGNSRPATRKKAERFLKKR
jgi:hypothetical protein